MKKVETSMRVIAAVAHRIGRVSQVSVVPTMLDRLVEALGGRARGMEMPQEPSLTAYVSTSEMSGIKGWTHSTTSETFASSGKCRE